MEPWKEIMKKLKQEHLKRTAPGFYAASGGDTMTLKPYSDKTFNCLKNAVTDFIKFQGGKITDQKNWNHKSRQKKTLDIIAVLNSKMLFIEIQPGCEGMTGDQLMQKLRVEGSGGLFYAAGNMPDFLEWWQNIGNPLTMKRVCENL